MANVLVLANETIGGGGLLDAVRERHAEGDARFYVVVPQSRPRHGNVIYDEAVRDSAQVRVDLALAFMRDEGIEGTGEVGDADPFNAAMDAVGAHGIDEIVVSTLPATTSRRVWRPPITIWTPTPSPDVRQLPGTAVGSGAPSGSHPPAGGVPPIT